MFNLREKIVTMPRKQQKREARREVKAEKAAVLEKVKIYSQFSFFFKALGSRGWLIFRALRKNC